MAQKSSSITDFEILNKLGKGSFGTVYKVRRKADKNMYVMKQINISQLNSAYKSAALNEAKILSSLESPFIVKYYDSFVEKNVLHIVMEYCEGGDLANHIRGQLGRPLPENKIWKFFIQMCVGLKYIHGKKILHRDIKSMNIFLTKDEEIRIGDLGVAKAMAESANFAHTMVGTPYYLSPEMCEEKPYNEKSDIWALGCVLYEMCTQKPPFDANNQAALLLKILRGKFNPISSGYSAEIAELVSLCLCKDYRKRPSADAILSRPSVMTRIKALSVYLGPEPRSSVQNQPSQEIANKDKFELKKEASNPVVNKGENQADKSNLKKDPSAPIGKLGANLQQRPVTVAKDIGRPSVQDPIRKINEAKTPQAKVEQKLEIQNGLMKVFENHKPAINFASPKNAKKDQPASVLKEDPNKAKLMKNNKVSQGDLLMKPKEIERPQRISTPQLNSKPVANPEPQQKLVGKMRVEPPVIMRPRLLEDKEKAPPLREPIKEPIVFSHKKNVSEVIAFQSEINEVKNLPDVVFPTPKKDKVKGDQKSAAVNKGNFFGGYGKGKKQERPRSDLPSFLPQKVILENKPKSYMFAKPPSTQQQVDDKFIEKEFPSTTEDSKSSNLKSIIEEKISSYEGSPNKFDNIPVTEMDKDDELFEVTNADDDEEADDQEEDRDQDDNDNDNEDSENEAYDEEEDEQEEEKQMESDDKNEDEEEEEEVPQKEKYNRSIKKDEKKDVGEKEALSKLEEAQKRKAALEGMIKERTNKFITKWGQRIFDELSGFCKAKLEDEDNQKSEAEIDDFLTEKLKGDIQPEQVFFIMGQIAPLEHKLEKVNLLIKKYSEELEN